MELKKWKNKKNQETDGYGRDKSPKTEKLKRKGGNNDNWKLEKKLKQKKSRKAVRVSVKSVRIQSRTCLTRPDANITASRTSGVIVATQRQRMDTACHRMRHASSPVRKFTRCPHVAALQA